MRKTEALTVFILSLPAVLGESRSPLGLFKILLHHVVGVLQINVRRRELADVTIDLEKKEAKNKPEADLQLLAIQQDSPCSLPASCRQWP